MAEEMKKEQETAAETQQKEDALKAKYGKIYRVGEIGRASCRERV